MINTSPLVLGKSNTIVSQILRVNQINNHVKDGKLIKTDNQNVSNPVKQVIEDLNSEEVKDIKP